MKRNLIRPAEGGGLKRSPTGSRRSPSAGRGREATLREGDKVEARYGGHDKWFPGKIKRVRSDGSYYILYDDGDSEKRVRKKLIKRKRGGGGFSAAAAISRRGGGDAPLKLPSPLSNGRLSLIHI